MIINNDDIMLIFIDGCLTLRLTLDHPILHDYRVQVRVIRS
jgi:hypothetical protein